LEHSLQEKDWISFAWHGRHPSVEAGHDKIHNYGGGLISLDNWTDSDPPFPIEEWIPIIKQLMFPDEGDANILTDLKDSKAYNRLLNKDPDYAHLMLEIFDNNEFARPFVVIQIYYVLDVPTSQIALSDVPIAGFDPLFYFHHANIDRYFWKWQQDPTHKVSWVDPGPDHDGHDPAIAPPGQRGLIDGQNLTVDTLLTPFNMNTTSVLDTKTFEYTFNDWQPHYSKDERIPFRVGIDKRNLRNGERNLYVMKGKQLLGASYIFSANPSCPNCQVNHKIYVPIHLRRSEGEVRGMIIFAAIQPGGLEQGISVLINGVVQRDSFVVNTEY